MNMDGSTVYYGDYETHVSNEAVDNLILSIYDYAQKSNEIISQIENIIDATENCYMSPYAETYRTKFRNLCSQKQMINKNILSYKTDLVNVKNQYELMEKSNSRKLLDD